MGRVENKVVIVTGAASGRGAADARAGHGARVVMTDINEAAGRALAGHCRAHRYKIRCNSIHPGSISRRWCTPHWRATWD